jgi:hypothetical protein
MRIHVSSRMYSSHERSGYQDTVGCVQESRLAGWMRQGDGLISASALVHKFALVPSLDLRR